MGGNDLLVRFETSASCQIACSRSEEMGNGNLELGENFNMNGVILEIRGNN